MSPAESVAAGAAESVAAGAAAVSAAWRDLEPGTTAVHVPATSANLGPGYDALGVALDVGLVVVAGPRVDARVTSVGFGEGELPTGDDNLVWRALVAWCQRSGTVAPDVSLTVHSAIPLERGMGSSSAAAVAGVVLGRALAGGDGGVRDLLAIATELEGHPDNAAPALVGGLTICTADGGFQRVAPTAALRPVLLVPRVRQNTNAARGVLPEDVPLSVAAANGARGAATFAALAGVFPLESAMMVDELHEPPRLAIMASSGQLVEGLRDAGVPAALSGAGPAVLALPRAGDTAAFDLVREVVGLTAPDMEVVPTAWDLAGATTKTAPIGV